MKIKNNFLIIVLLIFSTVSCKKDEDPTSQGSDGKTIGSNGGTISSNDNKTVIMVPSQATSADVKLSIIPTGNTAPSGIGNIIKLEPEGQKFNKPVTLSLSYTDADAQTTPPELMAVAFKKPDNTWEILPNAKLDKNVKTISVQTSHFSEWSIIKVNEGINFTTKAFSINDIHGNFFNDSLNVFGENADYFFSLFYKTKLLSSNRTSALQSFSFQTYPFDNSKALGKYGVLPYAPFPSDTTVSFIKVTTFATGSGTYNVGNFSALVRVFKYNSNNNSGDTTTITAKDTLRGTFRIKQK